MGEYMKSIYGLTIDELENFLLNNDEKKYRANQIMDWLYVKRVDTFNEMSNLSKELINKLEKNFNFDKISIIKSQKDLDVFKYLFKFMCI